MDLNLLSGFIPDDSKEMLIDYSISKWSEIQDFGRRAKIISHLSVIDLEFLEDLYRIMKGAKPVKYDETKLQKVLELSEEKQTGNSKSSRLNFYLESAVVYLLSQSNDDDILELMRSDLETTPTYIWKEKMILPFLMVLFRQI